MDLIIVIEEFENSSVMKFFWFCFRFLSLISSQLLTYKKKLVHNSLTTFYDMFIYMFSHESHNNNIRTPQFKYE
jgi:hypothetical protein